MNSLQKSRVAGRRLPLEMQNYRPSNLQQAERPVCMAAVQEARMGEESRTLGRQVELRSYGLWPFQHYNMAANYKVISIAAFRIES